MIRRTFASCMLLLLVGCVRVPEGIDPVTNFDSEAYLGTWYEIARLENRFEAGMSNVTASYSLYEDGSIRVRNKGFLESSKSWKEVEGRAVAVGSDDVGHLKVSFFGPFYSSYIVFELAADYSYSFVTSSNKDFLWFLSRSPEVGDVAKQTFKDRVSELGFEAEEILFVDQSIYANQ